MTEVVMVVLGIGVAWVAAMTMLVLLLSFNQDERESRRSFPAASPLNPADHPATQPGSSAHPEPGSSANPEPGTIDRAS